MQKLEDILKSTNADALTQLKNAPETQKIFELLNQRTDGSLEQTAEKAAKGDTAPLLSAIRTLMQTPEGAHLFQQLKSKLN